MKQSQCIAIFIGILFCIKGTRECEENICLTWEVTKTELILTCEIDFLHLGVFVDDPYGKTQAECFPPVPYECEAYYSNGSIIHNQWTKETIFKLIGNIDYRINGNWTCRHGTSKDTATAHVLLLKVVENNGLNDDGDVGSRTFTALSGKDEWLIQTRTTTIETTSIISTLKGLNYDGGFGSSTYTPSARRDDFLIQTRTTTLETTSYISTYKGQEEHTVYYVIASIVISLVVISLILYKVRIRGKYRIVRIKTSNSDNQNNVRESAELQSTEDITAHYETIDENEMMNNPISLSEEHLLQENVIPNNTTNFNVGSRSSLSTYSSEYEEVVNRYCNLYQSLENTRENVDEHKYCTAVSCSDVHKISLNLRIKEDLEAECKLKAHLPQYTRHNTCTSLILRCNSDETCKLYHFQLSNSLPNNLNVFNSA